MGIKERVLEEVRPHVDKILRADIITKNGNKASWSASNKEHPPEMITIGVLEQAIDLTLQEKNKEVKEAINNFFDPETLEQIFPEYGAEGEPIELELLREELKKRLE